MKAEIRKQARNKISQRSGDSARRARGSQERSGNDERENEEEN
jgi:hypothetical protein